MITEEQEKEICEFYTTHSSGATCKKYHFHKPHLLKILQKYEIAEHTKEEDMAYSLQQRKATNLEKYGVESIFQSEEFIEQNKRHQIETYGGVGFASKQLNEQAKETCESKYGDKNYNNPEQNKLTSLKKYGVEHYNKLDAAKQHLSEINKRDEIKNKIKQTNLLRYGVEYPSQLLDNLKKREETNLNKFGAVNYAQTEEYKIRQYETKQKNKSFTTSKPEEDLYQKLSLIYGKEDVKRQYTETRYPFQCDFYIPSRDIFIELNLSWTHGGKLFEGTDEDLEKLNLWIKKAEKSDYYKNAIQTWTVRDVKKFTCAKTNNLHYIAIYGKSEIDTLLKKLTGEI